MASGGDTKYLHHLEDMIRLTWPDWEWHEVQWITHGWDFDIAILDGRTTVRIPKSPGQRRRLLREVAWLDALSVVNIPRPNYLWRSPLLCAYPYIEGDSLSADKTRDQIAYGELVQYLTVLHQTACTEPEVVRTRWRNHHRAFYREVSEGALALFSVSEERRIRGKFDKMAQRLEQDWQVALLHGDLVYEHVLVHDGHISGIIDWGDIRYGDLAFDFAGIAEMSLPDPDDESFLWRRNFYRWARAVRELIHAMKMGNVEQSEQRIRVIRREL